MDQNNPALNPLWIRNLVLSNGRITIEQICKELSLDYKAKYESVMDVLMELERMNHVQWNTEDGMWSIKKTLLPETD